MGIVSLETLLSSQGLSPLEIAGVLDILALRGFTSAASLARIGNARDLETMGISVPAQQHVILAIRDELRVAEGALAKHGAAQPAMGSSCCSGGGGGARRVDQGDLARCGLGLINGVRFMQEPMPPRVASTDSAAEIARGPHRLPLANGGQRGPTPKRRLHEGTDTKAKRSPARERILSSASSSSSLASLASAAASASSLDGESDGAAASDTSTFGQSSSEAADVGGGKGKKVRITFWNKSKVFQPTVMPRDGVSVEQIREMVRAAIAKLPLGEPGACTTQEITQLIVQSGSVPAKFFCTRQNRYGA